MTDMTTQLLFDKCAETVKAYPSDMCALSIGNPVAGRGFFPVATGSSQDGRTDIPLTPRKLMFVGQDWGAHDSFKSLKENLDADMYSGTAARLASLLKEAGIPIEECFFTNALFGVREGKTNTGRSPGWKDEAFVTASAEALKLQIKAIQPKAMICLGRDAPCLLALLIPERKAWSPFITFKAIDEGNHGVLSLASNSGPMDAAILTHPSYRHINARQRYFRGLRGHAAEVQLLKSVCSRTHSLGD